MTLRVLLVTANYRPSVGGIERFVEVLAEELARRGHIVRVACCREGSAPLRERSNDVGIVRLRASNLPRRLAGVPYPIPSPLELVRTLPALVDRSDVVHVQDAVYLTSVAALSRARRHDIPTVLTQHVGIVPQRRYALDLAQRVATRAVRSTVRGVEAIATYNDAVADWAVIEWDIPRPRLLPSGVIAPKVTPAERARARSELDVRDDEFIALFAGRDVPKKHLDVFLEAADPAAYQLVAVTDRRALPPAGTRILPFMPAIDFARLLASVDAFVLPSEGEGFPLALQEALLAGVPSVITRHPGYDRYVGDGDAVFIERSATAIREALRQLASDPGRRREIGRRAQAAGERSFGVRAFADAYESLYTELLDRRSTPNGASRVAPPTR